MKLTQEQRHYVMAIVGFLTIVGGSLVDYLLSGEVINKAGLITAAGVGLMAWAKQRKGDVSLEDAKRMAEKAARASVLPPGAETARGVPADDTREYGP